MDLYRDPVALARVEALMRLGKPDLISMARGSLPSTPTRRTLDRWRKVELAWAIVRAEVESADGPNES